MKKLKEHLDGVKICGSFRVQITEKEKGIVWDSGWIKNQITDLGIRYFIIDWLATGVGKSVTHMALGTGIAPVAAATTLPGEITQHANSRATVTKTIINSNTIQYAAVFSSDSPFLTETTLLSNVGLFDTSIVGSGQIFAGNIFTPRSCQTNQNVNMTYQISFAGS